MRMKKSLLNSGTYKSHLKPGPRMLCYATVQMSSRDLSHIYCILCSNVECSGMRGLGHVFRYSLHPTTAIQRMPPSISLSLSLSLSLFAHSLLRGLWATLQTMTPRNVERKPTPRLWGARRFPRLMLRWSSPSSSARPDDARVERWGGCRSDACLRS